MRQKTGIKRISVTNQKARDLLVKVSEYDAATGDPGDQPDFTQSLIVALKVRVDDIASTPQGRRWLKEYDQKKAAEYA